MQLERRGASYLTVLIADGLADAGRPVTVDELAALIDASAGVPWAGISQAYQQYKCQQNQGRAEVKANGSAVTSGFDPALGWRYPGFDPTSRTDLRKALCFVVGRTLTLTQLPGHRRWAVKHPGDPVRWSRSPGVHPVVRSGGRFYDWTPELRAESRAEAHEAVEAINVKARARRFEQLTPAQRAVLLRSLADLLPRADPVSAGRVRALILELKQQCRDDPAATLRLIEELAALRT